MSITVPAPWYRHRWPWLLIAGPGIVVVASFITLWLAIKSDDGLVADDYYKQGLAINRTLARGERAQAMGLQAFLNWREGRIELRLTAHADAPLPTRLRLTLSHPTRSGLDQVVVLNGRDGLYGGVLASAPAGRRQLLLENETDEGASWRLAGLATLKEGSEVVLLPLTGRAK